MNRPNSLICGLWNYAGACITPTNVKWYIIFLVLKKLTSMTTDYKFAVASELSGNGNVCRLCCTGMERCNGTLHIFHLQSLLFYISQRSCADINSVVAKVLTACRNCFPIFVFTYFHQNVTSLSGICSWYVSLIFVRFSPCGREIFIMLLVVPSGRGCAYAPNTSASESRQLLRDRHPIKRKQDMYGGWQNSISHRCS